MIGKSHRSANTSSTNRSLFTLPYTALLSLTVLLSSCGGGGGGGDQGSVSFGPSSWTSGTFRASSQYAAKCAHPRSSGFPDIQGTTTDENNWLRSWTHELYLWYGEVPDLNPSTYADTEDYFDLLKTTAITSSGQYKDRFHFTYPTDVWQSLSQSGVQAGYGVQWVIINTAPRRAIVGYIEAGSPATTANLARGAQIQQIDGVDIVTANTAAEIDALNAGLFPDATGQSHTFIVLDSGASTPRAVVMTSASITSVPVQNVHTINTGSGLVGYLLFNDHIATAELQLVNAITTLKAAGISDLVIDIRYNGGGYLDIANEFAYMIAGPTATSGKTFEELQFNDQHPTTDPVTGDPLTPIPFHSTTQGFSVPSGQALPTLNLSRVFVLTGSDTCSASESIINSLRGIDVDVIQIGSKTCGKPYGFYPFDNCGTTYFSIQFRGINNKGFGDYADGFSPANSGGSPTTPIPGCSVADDFGHALGDVAESRLAAALTYRNTQSCPTASGLSARMLKQTNDVQSDSAIAPKSPWLQNRIMRR